MHRLSKVSTVAKKFAMCVCIGVYVDAFFITDSVNRISLLLYTTVSSQTMLKRIRKKVNYPWTEHLQHRRKSF